MPPSVAHKEWTTSEKSTLGSLRLPRFGDERLARLAAHGSTRAFTAVYERYHQPLYRYCRSILRDDADAQDALQSTFTRALSALQRGQRSAPLRPWLFRIAHNESISVLRRRRSGGGTDPLDGASIPPVPSAEDEAGERARLGVLMGDLAALPARARNALVMRELTGLSHEDIAIALGISQGAAKQAIFEARRGLQECAEGRAMPCAEVCRAISDGDRRVLRGRRVRAHVRDCTSCAAFASAVETRQAELRALVPVLPAAASAAVLARVIHGGAVGGGIAGGGAGGAAVAGTAGKTVGIAIGSKGFTAASLLATAAVSVGGVAAVVRLSHDGRPAVAADSGGHGTVARPGVHRASAAGGSPTTASVRAALGTAGTASGPRAMVVGKLPARTTATRGHARSAPSPGQSGSFAHGRSGSFAHGRSGSFAHGRSGSSSHGKSGLSHGNGHAKSASGARGDGKQTAPGRMKKTVVATEQYATVHAHPNRGLGAAKKVGTDVPGSHALTIRKAHT
jgi:RNA polymerase sigma factor (sigma-70 family)